MSPNLAAKIKVLVNDLVAAHRHHAQSLILRASRPEIVDQEAVDAARIGVATARQALNALLESETSGEDHKKSNGVDMTLAAST